MKDVDCAHDTSASDATRPACALGIQGGSPGAGWCQNQCKRRVARATEPAGVLAATEAYFAAARSILAAAVKPSRRAAPEEIARRLAVCAACPGKHAILRDDGSAVSCGHLLKGTPGKANSPCGCYLSAKARDTRQQCPFGYWEPKLETDKAETDNGAATPSIR